MKFRSLFSHSLANILILLMGMVSSVGHANDENSGSTDAATIVPVRSASIIHPATGRILDAFKAQERDILFDTLPLRPEEETVLFDNENKGNALRNLLGKIETSKDGLLQTRGSVTRKRLSLQKLITNIDDTIRSNESAMKEVRSNIRSSNIDIIRYATEIRHNEKRIAEDQTSIRKYLAYIYSRGDLVYDTNQNVDLLKTIIMNDGDVGGIFDDIHSKSIVELAGQNFVEGYRSLIREYYYNKEHLKREKFDLIRLKTRLQEATDTIRAQRTYREQVLAITKGQEDLFTAYINQKHSYEKTIIENIQGLATEYEDVFTKVGVRSKCTDPDMIATATGMNADIAIRKFLQSAATDPNASTQCRQIGQIFQAEKALHDSVNSLGTTTIASGTVNFSGTILEWPVTPSRGISAYYHDDGYYALYGSEHEAIDIPVSQGTDIRAPMAGYISFINAPTPTNYGYVAIKHPGGFVTVYGHVSEVIAKPFDIVRPGDVFAKSGGTPGTPGAGPATQGAHLHFEVWKNRNTIDPLRYLDLSVLTFDNLNAKYRYKYIDDLKARYGTHANTAKYQKFLISGDTELDRQKFLLTHYASKDFQDWNMWVEESVSGKVDPSFVMCIGLAESSLGNSLKSGYNVGNVGNDDSGNTYEFDNARTGVSWIVKTLNNVFLGKYMTIDKLSRYGNKTGSIYASSSRNWQSNIVRCLSALKGRFTEDDYHFRTGDADKVTKQDIDNVPIDILDTPQAIRDIQNHVDDGD